MYKICFYVPENNLDEVKDAMFTAGAGKIGNYSNCCWQTKGRGQFKPLAGSNPQLGQHHKICFVEEYKVEMTCEDHLLEHLLKVLRNNHPYEEPAYEAYKIIT
jgi:hypothetical protein